METRRILNAVFNADEVLSSLARLRGESAELNSLFVQVTGDQESLRSVRCLPEVQIIWNIGIAHGFDAVVIQQFIGALFGFSTISPC